MYKKESDLPTILKLLTMARDLEGPKGAARLLLLMLILRAAREHNYSCFPSYGLLASDCNCNMKTLKLAAAELEKLGLIKRVIRRNRSNKFFINVELIMSLSAAHRAERAAEKEAVHEGVTFSFIPTSGTGSIPSAIESDDENEDPTEDDDQPWVVSGGVR